MRIQEVESRSEISKKNIRFYEEEGLIIPRRNRENGYREYSEQDVATLKKIRLFRRLGISIDEIRKLMQGLLTPEDLMERHRIILERQQKNLELSKEICRQIHLDGCSVAELDPDIYLTQMDVLERKGASFMDYKNTDRRKKKVAPVVAALVMILIMLWIIGVLLWAYFIEPIPLIMLLIIIVFPAAVCIGVVLALISRFKEINRREAEEAEKY